MYDDTTNVPAASVSSTAPAIPYAIEQGLPREEQGLGVVP